MVRILLALLMVWASVAEAGTINRPTKTFGGASFINGVTPQASDFNGDVDTLYGEFNGNIDNNNIKTGAAIDASKVNPDGFTVNLRVVNASPCYGLDENDQGADLRLWRMCSNAGVLSIWSYNNAGVSNGSWFSINRTDGSTTIGGTGGTNTINGTTTFNQPVIFAGSSSILPTGVTMTYMGTVAPTGWLLMDGSEVPCTGVGAVNAPLCTQLVSLFGSANYKGTPAATITVDPTSDEVVHTAHARVVNDRVHFSTSGTLPSPLVATSVYCVQSVTADRYKLKACGGANIDITTSGTGSHSDYFNMKIPDTRGRTTVGTGTGVGLSARIIGATGGEENHLLTLPETPVHNHNNGGYNLLMSAGPTGSEIGDGNGTGPNVNQSGAIQSAGGGGSHNVMDPFIVMSYIIKL